MTVASDVQDVTYATDGSTVGFPIPFYFLADAHIGASLIAADGTLTELFLGSDFSIAGAGNPDGGTLTTLTVRPAGFKLHICRSVPVTQETQYQQNDAFPAKTTEKALDKLTMIDQQHAASIGRALQVPMSDIAPNTLLPKAAVRANKALGFDNAGNPFAIELIIGSVTVPVVDSIAMLRLISKASTQTVIVAGYYKPADRGGGTYCQNTTITPGTAFDNGGTRIVAADGGVWDLQLTGTVSIMQFGARSGDIADGIDVADNTARIQACLNCGLGQWEVPEGRFMFDDLTIPFFLRFVLYGSGPGSTLVQMGDVIARVRFDVAHELRYFDGLDPGHVLNSGPFLQHGLGVDVRGGIARAPAGHDPVLEDGPGPLEHALGRFPDAACLDGPQDLEHCRRLDVPNRLRADPREHVDLQRVDHLVGIHLGPAVFLRFEPLAGDGFEGRRGLEDPDALDLALLLGWVGAGRQ